MEKTRDLLCSSGKIEDETKSWDIAFWQSVSTAERFRAASEMIRAAVKHKTGKDPAATIDKSAISFGSYSDV